MKTRLLRMLLEAGFVAAGFFAVRAADRMGSKGAPSELDSFGYPTNVAKAAYQARIEAMARKPDQATGTYRVRAGDTLFQIARQHGVTVKALAEANPGVDATRMKVGQKLTLPSKRKLGTHAPSRTATS